MAHWANTARDIKLFGISAIAYVPVIVVILFPNIFLFFCAIISFIFFIIVEKVLKIRVSDLISYIRFSIVGVKRTPKTKHFDF